MRTHEEFSPAVLSTIFDKMQTISKQAPGKWQRSFLIELFRTVFALRGRINFTNLARFSPLHEQTFRRHFRKAFAWVAFNLTLVRLRRHPREELIGVFDCTFLPKSGSQTWGLDRFFSSVAGGARQGLEASVLGVIATTSRRAFGLDVTQTPAGLSKGGDGYSRVDVYGEQVIELAQRIKQAGFSVAYWVGDGYYAKLKILAAVVDHLGAHLITRLRRDSNLRYLYHGPPKQGGKKYDGKVHWSDREELLRRFDEVGRLPDHPQVRVLTTVANSPHFGHNFRVVVLFDPEADKHVVLCSTDTEQPADEVVAYYRLRYQIEFVIRDAKQHTGMTHCQARSQEKIDFHLNMSVAAVGVLRLLASRAGLSPRSYRREAYNRLLVERLFAQLGLQAEFDVFDPRVQPVVQMGRMAA